MEILLKNLEDYSELTLAIKFCKETQFRYSNGKYFTKSNVWEEHDSIQRLSTEFAASSRKFLKETARQWLGTHMDGQDTVHGILLLAELCKKLHSDQYINQCIAMLQNLDYFCDNAQFYLGVNQPGLIRTRDQKVMNPKCQIVQSDQPITKSCAMDSEKPEEMMYDFPRNFRQSLAQGLFSCPKNERGERVILQMAGPHRHKVIDWFVKAVAGEYACRANSVGNINRSNCRIAFLELGEDNHAADILRALKKTALQPCLVVISTDDMTALDVDSFWEPLGLRSYLETPVKEWLKEGCSEYSVFHCIHSEPEDQVSELLNKFLKDQCILPTQHTAKNQSSRMKVSELADILQNRARHKGMMSLKVRCKELKERLKARHFHMVRPQGTSYFTYKVSSEK